MITFFFVYIILKEVSRKFTDMHESAHQRARGVRVCKYKIENNENDYTCTMQKVTICVFVYVMPNFVSFLQAGARF